MARLHPCAAAVAFFLCCSLQFGARAFSAGGGRPFGQKVLGVDVGTRKTGIASGAGLGAPREVAILRKNIKESKENREALADEVIRCAIGEGASEFVVGKPLTRDGQDDWTTQLAITFAKILYCRAREHPILGKKGVRVYLVDERFTSSAAEALLADPYGKAGKRGASKEEVDALSACLLLEQFLEEEEMGRDMEIVGDSASDPEAPPPS